MRLLIADGRKGNWNLTLITHRWKIKEIESDPY